MWGKVKKLKIKWNNRGGRETLKRNDRQRRIGLNGHRKNKMYTRRQKKVGSYFLSLCCYPWSAKKSADKHIKRRRDSSVKYPWCHHPLRPWSSPCSTRSCPII